MIRFSRRQDGFSLVELLAVVAILMVVITLIVTIFVDSERTRGEAGARAASNNAGLAAIQMISRDLRHAVADRILTFAILDDRYGSTSYGFDNGEVCMVCLEGAPVTNRLAREIFYWVEPMTNAAGPVSNRFWLVRGEHAISDPGDTAAADNCYTNRAWYEDINSPLGRPYADEVGIVAENVAGFRLGAADADGFVNAVYESAEPVNSNRLPLYVDVYLELLDGRTARQVAEMARQGLSVAETVEENVLRYTTRVSLHHRNGYRER